MAVEEKIDWIDWTIYRADLSYAEQTQAAYAYLRHKAKELGYDKGGDHLLAAAEHLEAHERYLRGCVAFREANPQT